MNGYIALLRGINVGSNTKLPMADLVALMQTLGAKQIQTYIQSGNVIFQSSDADKTRLKLELAEAIYNTKGFKPQILLLELADLEKAIINNPFPEANGDPKSLHLYFLAQAVQSSDVSELEKYKKETEAFRLIDNVFYLYAPEGIARSKLAERVEKALGVAVTARNWRTVSKLQELALSAS